MSYGQRTKKYKDFVNKPIFERFYLDNLDEDELENICEEEQLNIDPHDMFTSSFNKLNDDEQEDLFIRRLKLPTEISIENPNFNITGKKLELINSKEYHPLKDSSGLVSLRKKPKIIRYRKYKQYNDAVNYYREQLMLFTHWRVEAVEIENINHYQRFLTKKMK